MLLSACFELFFHTHMKKDARPSSVLPYWEDEGCIEAWVGRGTLYLHYPLFQLRSQEHSEQRKRQKTHLTQDFTRKMLNHPGASLSE